MITDDVTSQILIEIEELIVRIDESIATDKPRFIVNMYREMLLQKQKEFRLLFD